MTQALPPRPKVVTGVKHRGHDKVSLIPTKVVTHRNITVRKPEWLKIKLPQANEVQKVKKLLRSSKLHTVCEEANCPNLNECFTKGTATFMILGDICTRRCPFCDVAHGRPKPVDINEPTNLANAVESMQLKYVVITSVDRDDLRDGGATHFIDCISALRNKNNGILIEILVPDFRGRMDRAVEILTTTPPDVFNHNLESVPSLYKKIRPGSDYQWSLDLLKNFKKLNPNVPTKSGLMLGLGEDINELKQVLHDLRAHDVDMVTMGQYLAPSQHHLPVIKYITPQTFADLEKFCYSIGFKQVASGPLVRSSYHAEQSMEQLTKQA